MGIPISAKFESGTLVTHVAGARDAVTRLLCEEGKVYLSGGSLPRCYAKCALSARISRRVGSGGPVERVAWVHETWHRAMEGSGMDFTYKRVGARNFDTTVEAVERTVRSHGFVLSRTHDIKATLAAKGFNIQPLKVFEVVMRPDTGEPGTAERDLINVCRLHVYVEDGVVHVTAIRPTAMSRVFSDRTARAEAVAIEDSVVRLVDEVVNW